VFGVVDGPGDDGEEEEDDDDDDDNCIMGADDVSGAHIGRSSTRAAGGGVCCVQTGIAFSLAAFNARVKAVTRPCPTAAARDCAAARVSLPAETNVFMLFAAQRAARDNGASSSAYAACPCCDAWRMMHEGNKKNMRGSQLAAP
jgi:hypothetical protein